MDSDLQQQKPQINSSSGLTRYRSAPSSFFNNIIDRDFYEHIFNRPSSPETERVFSRFMNSLREDDGAAAAAAAAEEEEEYSLTHQNLPLVKEEIVNQQEEPSILNNNGSMVVQQQQHSNNYTHDNEDAPAHSFYRSSARPPLPNQSMPSSVSGMEGTCSMGGNNRLKTGVGSLIRHSSSPAGLFSQINVENDYAGIRGLGSLGTGNNNNTIIEEPKFSTARRLKNNPQLSGRMSSIAEIGDKLSNRENIDSDSEAFGETHGGNDFVTGLFPVGSWDDSDQMVSDNVTTGRKRFRDDDDAKPFSSFSITHETQNETGGQTAHSSLAHQLSLPNTSSEMAAIEKFLQFSDSVPCKIRAKRGCATHPRSIAERVRRTKISERMRKLQDLVPNMEKQTNTADMLDLAVDYIKELQKEVKTLSDCHAKCTCSHKQQQ